MSVEWVPVVFGLGFFAAIGAGLRRWNRNLLRDLDDTRDMRSVGRARASNAREGAVVRVVGRVTAGGELLIAPVSGRPCVAYEFEVRPKGEERIGGDCSSRPFGLDDEGTRAATSSACRVMALRRRIEERGTGDDVPAPLAAWLEENHSSDEWRSMRKLTWWESRVEPGDTVAVVGVARRQIDPDGEAGYRDAPTVLMLDDADDAPLSVGDDPSLLT